MVLPYIDENMAVVKKVALLGDPSVGKTSLIRRYVFDMFEDSYLTTIGAKVVKKEMVIDDTELKLMLWDLLGQDTFDHLVSSTLKGIEGAFLVIDLTRKNTLERLPKFIGMVEGINPDIPLILLGNKKDLEEDIEVTIEDIEDFIGDNDIKYFLTSAKTGENVEEAFHALGKTILDTRKEE